MERYKDPSSFGKRERCETVSFGYRTQRLKIHENAQVVCALNEASEGYDGVHDLNYAFNDRFTPIIINRETDLRRIFTDYPKDQVNICQRVYEKICDLIGTQIEEHDRTIRGFEYALIEAKRRPLKKCLLKSVGDMPQDPITRQKIRETIESMV